MEIKQFTYFFLVLIFALIPYITGVWKKVQLRQKLKYIIPAILFTGAVFIIWDIRFTEIGIWSFNPDFITGISLLKLPVEEWLFLFIISINFFFVYEWVKIRFHNFEKPNAFLSVSLVLLALFGLTAYFTRQKLYPFFTFFLLTVYFGYTVFRNRFKKHFTNFYLAYFIGILPVIILKEILTTLPVIGYNNSHLLGVRIVNAPIEDFAYYFLLALMNISIFEYLNERRFY